MTVNVDSTEVGVHSTHETIEFSDTGDWMTVSQGTMAGS